MKTALQQAIEAIRQLQNRTGSSKSEEIAILQALLPTERQIIEDTYNNGFHQGSFSEYITPDYDSSRHYYNQTFNDKNDNDATN